MASQTILVTGATGGQGGSVASHLLSEGKFNVRALTRNPDSEKAQQLKSAGAEVVKGDLDNMDELADAMKDCYGVFGVTNFWEHFQKEYDHGKNIIDAVVKTNVSNFIFSTLANYKKLSGGKFDVPHCDLKAQLQEYAASLKPNSIFVSVAFYYENFLSFFPPQKAEDGSYSFGFPQGDTKLASVSVEDVGGVVARIFDEPEKYYGKVVGIVGDDLKGNEYAEIMTNSLGKKVAYNYISVEVYSKLGFPGAEELGNMFETQRLFIKERQKDVDESKRLFPGIQTFKEWMGKNKEKFSGMK